MTSNIRFLLVLILLVGAVLSGCVPKETPTPSAPATPVSSKVVPSPQDWQQKWDETVARAKKEGNLVVYSGINPEAVAQLKEAFGKRYEIQLDFLVGRGAEIVAKYQAEKSAGINVADVFNWSAPFKPGGFFAPIEPYLILPEVRDPALWTGGQIPYLDEDKTIIMLNKGYTSYVAINTDMVKEGQIKSLQDLLRPEWKDKVVLFDPAVPSAAAGWVTFILTKVYGWEKGEAYLRQFAATRPLITRETRQQIEWVARGKYAVAVGAQQAATSEFKMMGAPIGIVRWQEGGMINPGSGNVEVPFQMRHPHAATVFVNWILSKEGQTVFARSYGNPSWRVDVPAEGIDPFKIALPGEKIYVADLEFFETQTNKAIPLAKEIFGALLK